jgi:hypothetical protein
MPRRDLTDHDFCKAAAAIGCEPEYVKAVATVESRGSGFYDDGFPTILFERHKFYKHANRSKRDEWTRSYPEICNPKATPRGGYGTRARSVRSSALLLALDSQAAMMACSWGAFQELGENYDDCDFSSVDEFVDAMKSGIGGQLDIFIRSIKHRGLSDEMRRHDSRGFARNYNGPDYERFHYDTQIDSAYTLAKKHPIDCSKTAPPEETDDHDPLKQFLAAPKLDAGDTGKISTEPDPAGSKESLPSVPSLNSVGSSEANAAAASPVAEAAAVSAKPKLWERLSGRMTSAQEKLDKVTSFGNSLSPISGSSRFTVVTTKIGGWVFIVLGFFGDHLWAVIGLALIALAVYYLAQAKKNAAGRNAPAAAQSQTQTIVVPPAS